MLIVFIGGSGSGKSEYAENTALEVNNGELVYIATMQPFDEESKARVRRHQKMRECKNFKTIECYTGLANITLSKTTTVLLECMSNLAANEMFTAQGVKDDALEAIKQGVCNLLEQADNLLIVTNNIFEDGFEYDEITVQYMKLLGTINQWLCQKAVKVVEIVHGIPISYINNK